MKGRTRTVAVAGIACLAVAVPAAAQAKTKTVTMGLPTRADAKKFQKNGTDVNDFFPHGVTIHAGDKVKFVPAGFHSVEIPKKGGRVTPLVAPTGQKIEGVNDAAGQPFWFNGRDQVGFNPALFKGSFGKHVRYTGKKTVSTGLPLSPKIKPMVVKFTKAGRYTYFCNIHTGMKGTVRVRPASKKIPSSKADAQTVRNEVTRDLKIAKSLKKTVVPAKTVDVGSAGPHGVEFYAMFPLGGLTVHVGDSVLFRMTKGSYEIHTATFGPGDPNQAGKPEGGYLGDIEANLQGPGLDPRGVYPSEAPGSAAALTSALHGNGFWNSGAMDRANSTPLLAGSNSVTFDQPGDFQFYCLIHPFMHGTIHVTA